MLDRVQRPARGVARVPVDAVAERPGTARELVHTIRVLADAVAQAGCAARELCDARLRGAEPGSELLAAVVDEMAGRITGLMTLFLEGEGDVRERWHRLARDLAQANLCSLVAARNSIKSDHRPPARRLEDAEDEILALAERCVALAHRAGLVGAELTGERYFGGLLAVTRPLAVPFEEMDPGHREWLLGVYVRGLRPE